MLSLLSKTDAMQHEPRGFLSHPKRFRNFATAHTVLAVEYQPHCRKPLIQAERRILEDGSNLHRELPSWMTDTALPAQLILQEADAGATTPRAGNAVLPLRATGDKIAQAVFLIREVENCFLQALWFVSVFHALIVRQNRVLVNYIFTLFCVCFHLLPCHAFEQFVQVYVLTSVNPLAHGIDLGVRLDSGDHRGSRRIHLACLLDDALQRSTDVSAPSVHQPEYMSVAIHSVATDRVLLGYSCRTDPGNECLLDLVPFGVRADTALVLVTAAIHRILTIPTILVRRTHLIPSISTF